MKKLYSTIIMLLLCFCFRSITFCSDKIIAYPSSNDIYIKSQETLDKISDVDVYSINKENYFKLRDISSMMGYHIQWNNETKGIVINSNDGSYNNIPSSYDKGLGYSHAIPSNITLYINGNQTNNLTVYNIDGYNYFKLRDLAREINFYCIWDSTAQIAVVDKYLPYDDSTGNSITLKKIEDIQNAYKENDVSSITVEEDTYKYTSGSNNFVMVENCIKKYVDSSFSLNFYETNETYTDFINVNDSKIRILEFKLRSISNNTVNFGYKVYILNGTVKLIIKIGEEESEFYLEKIKNLISDEYLINKAILLDSLDYQITETRIIKYYNNETKDFDADVEIEYYDDGYFVTINKFNSIVLKE